MSLRLPNSCFIHIPRTGGMWLQDVVNNLGLPRQIFRGDIDSHYSWTQLPDNWKSLISFTLIRHPLAWVKSRWSHALEIGACEGHRHYHVHRKFDECVRPTLELTIQEILRRYPGLVYLTFKSMSQGIHRVFRTEDLPYNLFPFLNEHEGITPAQWESALVPPTNGTATIDKYALLSGLEPETEQRFLNSESLTVEWWNSLSGQQG